MEELKQYIHKTKKEILVLGIFAVVFAIAAIVLLIRHQWIIAVVMLLCAIALCFGTTNNASVEKKFYEGIENSTDKDAILADFTIAQPFADDDIRMGEKYIFLKKQARLITYEDISKIQYFEFHDNETNKIEPLIKVTHTNGACFTLCYLFGLNTQIQAQEIFDEILSKNPNVEIKM